MGVFTSIIFKNNRCNHINLSYCLSKGGFTMKKYELVVCPETARRLSKEALDKLYFKGKALPKDAIIVISRYCRPGYVNILVNREYKGTVLLGSLHAEKQASRPTLYSRKPST